MTSNVDVLDFAYTTVKGIVAYHNREDMVSCHWDPGWTPLLPQWRLAKYSTTLDTCQELKKHNIYIVMFMSFLWWLLSTTGQMTHSIGFSHPLPQ